MRCLACIVLSFVASLRPCHADHVAPRFTIDLSVDPEDRWTHIATVMKDAYLEAFAVFWKYMLGPLAHFIEPGLEHGPLARQLLPGDQYAEMKGIAKVLGLNMSQLIITTQAFSLMSGCDSIVAQMECGQIIHGRNLDFMGTQLLRPLAIQVDFVRDGVTTFTAVTLGPSPVFNTAVRYGVFSVSQDQRLSDQASLLIGPVMKRILAGHPGIFTDIRTSMESVAASTFEGAVQFFSNVEMPTGCYIILGGTRPGEGVVVTRSASALVNLWRLDAPAGRWYLAETNYDHWINLTNYQPANNDNRRLTINLAMNATGQSKVNATALFDILSINHTKAGSKGQPLVESDTVYTTIMQASNRTTFKTVIRSLTGELGELLV